MIPVGVQKWNNTHNLEPQIPGTSKQGNLNQIPEEEGSPT